MDNTSSSTSGPEWQDDIYRPVTEEELRSLFEDIALYCPSLASTLLGVGNSADEERRIGLN